MKISSKTYLTILTVVLSTICLNAFSSLSQSPDFKSVWQLGTPITIVSEQDKITRYTVELPPFKKRTGYGSGNEIPGKVGYAYSCGLERISCY
ncbi:MAG TPA: hypothetical protein PLX23_10550 [Candidatus Hydrogenedens sp.]|nr:hypothetical protein [Candidatus Hydrogenedens sp.]